MDVRSHHVTGYRTPFSMWFEWWDLFVSGVKGVFAVLESKIVADKKKINCYRLLIGVSLAWMQIIFLNNALVLLKMRKYWCDDRFKSRQQGKNRHFNRANDKKIVRSRLKNVHYTCLHGFKVKNSRFGCVSTSRKRKNYVLLNCWYENFSKLQVIQHVTVKN